MPRRPACHNRIRLVLECLEDRLAPAAYTVNDASWDHLANPSKGLGMTESKTITLLSALEQIAKDGGSGSIFFANSMSGAVIQPQSGFGMESVHVTINGFRINNVPAVTIMGDFTLGDNCTIHDMSFTGSSTGVTVRNHNSIFNNVFSGNILCGLFLKGDANTVRGNWFGVGIDGSTPSFQICGLAIAGANNTVGGPTQNDANIISGNSVVGVAIASVKMTGIVPDFDPGPTSGSGNVIIGNRIGLNALGSPVPNGLWGVGVLGRNNKIGGLLPGQGNFINAVGARGGVVFIDDPLLVGAPPVPVLPHATGNQILGNFIGTNADGSAMFTAPAQPPGAQYGVLVEANQFLTATTIQGNVIADSVTGVDVRVHGTANMAQTKILGNRIGVNAAGDTALRNRDGVLLEGTDAVTIGGTIQTAKNVISGNTRYGIVLNKATHTLIQGNYIGTNSTGNKLGNGVHGVYIQEGSKNFIGSPHASGPVAPAEANVIDFNGFLADIFNGERGHAIQIDAGDKNTIRGNSFRGNKALSVYLLDPDHKLELPQNDVALMNYKRQLVRQADVDTGPNGLVNVPVVKSVGAGKMIWQFNNAIDKTFTFDFYTDSAVHDLGHGQGEKWLSTIALKADKLGHIETTLSGVSGKLITATATDSDGNTSPFALVDSDADGLADGWEINNGQGIDFNMDGGFDQPLGDANPLRKNLYVESDVMDGAIDTKTVSIPNIFSLVMNAFADAPKDSINNPDGSAGVTLRIDYGSIPDEEMPTLWSKFESIKSIHFGEGLTEEQKQARSMAYRYSLFTINFAEPETGKALDYGGIGELTVVEYPRNPSAPTAPVKTLIQGSNDFLVAIPPNGFNKAKTDKTVTAEDLAGAFMHELGHTLGLQHGGTDRDNYKPNYYSVMNYTWAIKDGLHRFGVADDPYGTSWKLDYSRRAFPVLNEPSISEATTEIGGEMGMFVPVGTAYISMAIPAFTRPSGAPVFHVVPQKGKELIDGRKFIDFIRDLEFEAGTFGVDLNGDGKVTPLAGAEDWSRLNYNFRESPCYGPSHGLEMPDLSSRDYGFASPDPVESIVGGADTGSEPRVQVIGTDGNVASDFLALDANFKGGVRVAKGDVNGDGKADIIAAMGPGGGTVRAFDGNTSKQLWSVTPYGDTYTGGLNLAAGDTDKDAHAEVFVAPASGTGSTVQILSGADGSKVRDILAYTTTTKGGVTLAAGDVNGDGRADVITGLATVANPLVKVFNAADGKLIKSFTASSPAFNGVWLAAADVNGDGFADIIVGAGAGSKSQHTPLVRIYSGKNPVTILNSFLADDYSFHGGVRVAAVKLADGTYDIVTGTGPGKRVWRRSKALGLGIDWDSQAFDATFSGVFVG